jgi:hypothetical protein
MIVCTGWCVLAAKIAPAWPVLGYRVVAAEEGLFQ